MKEDYNLKPEILLCECHSTEHQYIFSYDKEDNMIYIMPHLNSNNGFFKRLWLGIKYIFGYRSRFGHWDEFILNPKDYPRLKLLLEKLNTNEKHK